MRTFIVKKKQLIEYVENKKAENVFYDIVESLHQNVKMLNENVSQQKVNQSIIDNYKRKNLMTPLVYEMLIKNKIIDGKHQIL